MMIDRRVFVAGAGLVAVTPALRFLQADAAVPPLKDVIQPVFLISGWSVPDDTSPDNQVWIRVGREWNTAWR